MYPIFTTYILIFAALWAVLGRLVYAGDWRLVPYAQSSSMGGQWVFEGLPINVWTLNLVDLDGDSDLDLVGFANARTSQMRNDGHPFNPVFAASDALLPVDAGVYAGAFLDFDGDGDVDMLVRMPITSGRVLAPVIFLANTGTLTHAEWAVPSQSLQDQIEIPSLDSALRELRAMDWDGDGHTDVLSAGFAPSSSSTGEYELCIRLHRSRGAGMNFDEPVDLVRFSDYGLMASSAPENRVLGFGFLDLDGDGLRDLVVSARFQTPAGVVHDAVWSARQAGTDEHPTWPVLESGGTAPLGLTIDGAGLVFTTADMNGDGFEDMIVPQGIYYRLPHATPARWAPLQAHVLGVHIDSNRIGFVDVQGRGIPSLYIVRQPQHGPATVSLWINEGTLHVPLWKLLSDWCTLPFPLSTTSSVLLADLNGNGHLEALRTEFNAIRLAENTGTQNTPQYVESPPTSEFWGIDPTGLYRITSAGDLNGDGLPELLALYYNGRGMVVYQNTSTSNLISFQPIEQTLSHVFHELPTHAVLADVNGDGLKDLLIMSPMPATIRPGIWVALNNGTALHPQWDTATFAVNPGGTFWPGAMAAADLDGDGRADLLLRERDNGSVQIYANHHQRRHPTRTSASVPVNGHLEINPTHLPGLEYRWIANLSGGTLDSETGVYTAGPQHGGVDVIEERDLENRTGRIHIQVVPAGDQSTSAKAIIIAGAKSRDDPVWPIADRMARNAYNTLRWQGYSKDNIQYLSFNEHVDVDGNGLLDDIDAPSTLTAAAHAFTHFLQGASDVFIYCVDHGSEATGEGYFRLNPGEILSSTHVGTWLNEWQSTHTGRVTTVLDFCHAGKWIAPLSASNRVTLASCSSDELAYFIAGGQVSYSSTFFSAVLQGNTLAQAHRQARDSMSLYQKAVIDTDGDGAPDIAVSPGSRADAPLAFSARVGRDIPVIDEVPGNLVSDASGRLLVWAKPRATSAPLRRVWAVVVPPVSHTPIAESNPVIDLPEIIMLYNPAEARYEALLAGFYEPGLYAVIFFAEDIWGGVSFPKQVHVSHNAFVEKVLLVCGGTLSDPGATDFSALADFAFNVILRRLIPAEQIRYLHPKPLHDATNDGLPDTHDLASLASIEEAITQWAQDADRLNLYFLGPSTNNHIVLSDGQTLTPTHLKTWLDNLQASRPVEIRMGFDFSGAGSYIPVLVPPTGLVRISSASSGPGRTSLLKPSLSFTTFFFSDLLAGKSIGEAIQSTRRNLLRASGNVRQRAWIDDDGNGIPNEKNVDAELGKTRFWGAAFVTGDDTPTIGGVIPMTHLAAGESLLLWADPVTDAHGIASVTCQIAGPSNTLANLYDALELTPSSLQPGRWEASWHGFNTPGIYVLSFQARDAEGNLSGFVQSSVIVKGARFVPGSPDPSLPDIYETDNTLAYARAVDLPLVESHTLHTADDCDWFMFFASSDFIYDIDVTHVSGMIDTELTLYRLSSTGLVHISTTDEFGYDFGELAGLDFPENGIYLVKVCHDQTFPHEAGEYIIRIFIPNGFSGLNIAVGQYSTAGGGPLGNVPIVIRDGLGLLIASVTSDPVKGTVALPELGPGSYTVEAVPPLPGYEKSYARQSGSSDLPENPLSYYGNPRALDVSDFGVINISGQQHTLAGTYVSFLFEPVSMVSGRVHHAHGPLTDAHVSFIPADGGDSFTSFRWVIGNAWRTTPLGHLPTTLKLPPDTAGTLHIHRRGYHPLLHPLTTPPRGQSLDIGLRETFSQDLNHNGIPDPWEYDTLHKLVSGQEDSDGDSSSDYEEYVAGTHPGDPSSVFGFRSLATQSENKLRLAWPMVPGRVYQLLAFDLDAPEQGWVPTAGPWAPGPGQTEMEITIPAPQRPGSLFKIEVRLP